MFNSRMNWACQAHLNRGFRAAEQYHTKCLKDVRAKLPRRESSRREHPYSRHCDILTAIGTRFEFYDQNQVYFQMIHVNPQVKISNRILSISGFHFWQ